MFHNARRTAAVAVTAVIGSPLALAAPAPALADVERQRDFRVAEARVDFSVEKEDGRFKVEVDIDEALQGTRWRVTLRHDGERFLQTVRTADDDGDVEIDRSRRDTRGGDRFTVTVKKIAGPGKSRTLRMR
ncbi:hypothetical protein EXE58_02235 [Nocardioides seonyuensis]|uniref:Uncharacterized protein n=1 Tax=Nocardioides seonyuensis TaxID=2518371 RepID=A0A4V1BLX6_9ACTN|nr:hypothetical protein [Nocardioides seonyuensis]QBX54402.1 hypothetical protein EXE58_02235 [Nocardioides seonyuensis]